MQTTLLALTIWLYGYSPTWSAAGGRHASRTPSKVSLVCVAQLLAGALLLCPAGTQSARPGRHQVSAHRLHRAAATPPPRHASVARGHDRAF